MAMIAVPTECIHCRTVKSEMSSTYTLLPTHRESEYLSLSCKVLNFLISTQTLHFYCTLHVWCVCVCVCACVCGMVTGNL